VNDIKRYANIPSQKWPFLSKLADIWTAMQATTHIIRLTATKLGKII